MEQNTVNQPDKLAALEAILFIHGEPLTRKRMRELLDLKAEDLEVLIQTYETDLAAAGRGLALISDREKIQLVTKAKFHSILEQFMKEQLSEDLTPAALETLAIIAYFGPISRSRIENQRGVNSIFTLRNLLLRGLVERRTDPARPNSFLYQPTFEFWKHLGLAQQADLPERDKFSELLAKFEAQPHE